MPTRRHIIVCEGESEWAYLQQLQSFLEKLPTADSGYDVALKFICPKTHIAQDGKFSRLKATYAKAKKDNRNKSIKIWADFDLYHRNDKKNADAYLKGGLPDFFFSFHNFEDFLALHLEDAAFAMWVSFGAKSHFTAPLHSEEHYPWFQKLLPGYQKGSMPDQFITTESLRRLQKNKASQPISNPHGFLNTQSFADFLMTEIEACYPQLL